MDVGYRMDLLYYSYYQSKRDGLSDDEILAGGTLTMDHIIYYRQMSELLQKMYTIGKEIGFK